MKTPRTKRNLVRVSNALDAALTPALSPDPPPLEREEPHKALARATKRHAQITEELRKLKSEWAEKNIKAQATRIAISTPECTFVETRRRDLHLQLEMAQAEIGRLNKEIRERKAEHQGNGTKPERRPEPKKMPFADDPEFPSYFILAARDTLAPELYAQVVRMAKSLIHSAEKMGIR